MERSRINTMLSKGNGDRINCPNCGAPIDSVKCPYCGTTFWNITDIDPDKPTYIRIKIGDNYCIFNVIGQMTSIYQDVDECDMYADGISFMTLKQPRTILHLELNVVPDDKGIFYMKKKGLIK